MMILRDFEPHSSYVAIFQRYKVIPKSNSKIVPFVSSDWSFTFIAVLINMRQLISQSQQLPYKFQIEIFYFNQWPQYFMIKSKNKDNFAHQLAKTPQNQNYKTIAQKSGDLALINSNLVQKILPFNFGQYPFLNNPKSEFKFYKTIFSHTLTQEQLKNVVAITHPNMIKIQKIAKGGGKVFSGKTGEVYYSIYYEVVPYSITEIANQVKKFNSLLPHLTSLNLCQQLLAIMEYLMKESIMYELKLEDIGISESGQVKVFISPLLLVSSKKYQLNKKQAIDSVDKILLWWKATVSKGGNFESMQSGKYYNILGNSFSANDQGTINQRKISSTSFIEKQREKNGLQSQILQNSLMHKSQTHENNTLNNQRMKKLDKELKLIRESLKQKVKDRIFKQKEGIFQMKIQKDKQLQPKKIAQAQESKVQSIQQNIHCINIFHSPVPISLDGVTNLHKYNGVFHKNNKQNMARQRKQNMQVVKPHYAYNHQIPDDLFHEQEDNLSVDTYQMDMGLDFQASAPNLQINNIPLGKRERQVSECNYKVKKQESGKMRQGGNQVTNKSVTVSAGPKQFKNFVVNFIKPQFLAKKSNIYEDPGEYESENSKSISNKFPTQYKELNQAGKSVTSHTQKSSSLAKESADKLQSKIINEQQFKNNDYNRKYMKKVQVIHTENNDYEKEGRFIKPQRSEAVIGSKKLEDLQIGKKVIEALEKTKNAIAILNKVKIAKQKNSS